MISVLKLAINYVKNKENNNKNFFDNFIDPFPLFVDFEATSKKYMSLFEAASVDEMLVIRKEYIQTRQKIAELVKLYKGEMHDQGVLDFLKSIEDFFFIDDLISSRGEYFIDLMSTANFSERERMIVVSEQQEFWKESVSLYGKLKLKYQQPIKI